MHHWEGAKGHGYATWGWEETRMSHGAGEKGHVRAHTVSPGLPSAAHHAAALLGAAVSMPWGWNGDGMEMGMVMGMKMGTEMRLESGTAVVLLILAAKLLTSPRSLALPALLPTQT